MDIKFALLSAGAFATVMDSYADEEEIAGKKDSISALTEPRIQALAE
jgi:hypothetical protein